MSDHHPTCPRCGDICEPGSERCECGMYLRSLPDCELRACACGCGEQLLSVDAWRHNRRYKVGHTPRDSRGRFTPEVPVEEKVLSPLAGWWSERFTAAEIRDLGAGL